MRISNKLQAAAALAFVGLSGAVMADDVYCPPNLGAVTIDGNVIVDGACSMTGTVVKGNVLVYDGGALTVRDARIDGNIQADGGVYVRVVRSDVGGDVQFEGLSGKKSVVARSTVGGNVQFDANTVPLVAQYNTIDGDLQALRNRGGVVILYNTIDGNLQCKSNRPAPTGGSNWVSGNKEDQCAGL